MITLDNGVIVGLICAILGYIIKSLIGFATRRNESDHAASSVAMKEFTRSVTELKETVIVLKATVESMQSENKTRSDALGIRINEQHERIKSIEDHDHKLRNRFGGVLGRIIRIEEKLKISSPGDPEAA